MELFDQIDSSYQTNSSSITPRSHTPLPFTVTNDQSYGKTGSLSSHLEVFDSDTDLTHFLSPVPMYHGSSEMAKEIIGVDENAFAPSVPEWYGQGNRNNDQSFEIHKQERCASQADKLGHLSLRSCDLQPSVTDMQNLGERHHSTELYITADSELENHVFSDTTSRSLSRSGTPRLHSPGGPRKPCLRVKSDSYSARSKARLRAKISIPSQLTAQEYARQCILAAYASRLSPFALHQDEQVLLRAHITQSQVTNYLNLRNGILRLWTRNPLVSVTREEAAGCARDDRWLGAADVAYEWLVRKGYINFGCTEVSSTTTVLGEYKEVGTQRKTRKTVVIVGAGMAGLGCARQLEGLFLQFAERWTSVGEEVPKVIVLEGRARIGGRVYSHPLRTQTTNTLPDQLRCTAELGAHIITGFDHGNPLNIIIRGQLALRYYELKDNLILYDTDGTAVDKKRDILAEKLYNDILDRAGHYRDRGSPPHDIEGDRGLIEQGRDSLEEDGIIICNTHPVTSPQALRGNEKTPIGVDKLTGRVHAAVVMPSRVPAAEAARSMGWNTRSGVEPTQTVGLDDSARSNPHPGLGLVMDDAIGQYQQILELDAQDMRLINWHYANLEYANAVNLSELSLGGWDQDTGNEFEGHHTQIIGGYLQVPRAIWQCPTQLDIKTRTAVKAINYCGGGSSVAPTVTTVTCEDGDVIEADNVVITVPLGILKEGSVQFEPPLPSWKMGPIARLGFGILNKVILVYNEAFWDEDRDMFGLLRDPAVEGSLNQQDYTSSRGRFYFFWNCVKTSGQPTLIALMAGDAAHQAEVSEDDDLIQEVTERLAKIFSSTQVPEPSEVIITRWGKDRFARGSYSYVGVEAQPGDYDAMARPVGNLHFAGEATCGTHPATVHGAYISGLRAASEIIESMLGPVKVPSPLIPAKPKPELELNLTGQKRKEHGSPVKIADTPHEATTREAEVQASISLKIGERPLKPEKLGVNPFLLYQKDHWQLCKAKCDEAHRGATISEGGAHRNDIRAALGKMWRDATEKEKRPYLQQAADNRSINTVREKQFFERVQKWDENAASIHEQLATQWADLSVTGNKDTVKGYERRAKKLSGYAESSHSPSGVDD